MGYNCVISVSITCLRMHIIKINYPQYEGLIGFVSSVN